MFALKIAARYLVAPKSHNVVNVIAVIAVVGVAIATAAMVVVLSVFNGFSDLAARNLSRLDPQLQVTRADGRMIADGDSLAAALKAVPGVAAAVPVLSERALAVTATAQTAVVFKGVPDGYTGVANVGEAIIDGEYATHNSSGVPAAQLSVGVSNALLARPDAEAPLHLYVPRRQGRINPANPAAAFRGSELVVSGVYRIDQPDEDADHIIIPLDVARDLLAYDTEASAVELALAPDTDTGRMQKEISRLCGPDMLVLDRLQQRTEAFRMISVEKWVTFMMLIFVLVIALFNIVSTLSLLIIEKRNDMRILRSLGARRGTVRAIFACEAWLITLIGGLAGLLLGVGLTLAQQYGKFIRLAGDAQALSIESYPVRLDAVDLAATFAAVVATGLVTAAVVRLLTKKL
ncbi:MAG: FtsX-like permease family protein [Bacteroidales bacterium]|nr:FtsX-like permease family protein [Bacteroidales bacterium]